MAQQGDIYLFQTDDDGDISVSGGLVKMSGGLSTAVYLSLFGGNEDDAGGQSTTLSWWGNVDENQPERKYRSETQNLLQSLPATSANLRRIEDAAGRDLDWMLQESVASSVTVLATIPALNRIKIKIDIEARGELSTFEFTENWMVSP